MRRGGPKQCLEPEKQIRSQHEWFDWAFHKISIAFFSFALVFLGPWQESSNLDSGSIAKLIIPDSRRKFLFATCVLLAGRWTSGVLDAGTGHWVEKREDSEDLLESSWRILKFQGIHRYVHHVHPFSIIVYFALRSSCSPGLTSLCTTSGNFLAHFLVDCVPVSSFRAQNRLQCQYGCTEEHQLDVAEKDGSREVSFKLVSDTVINNYIRVWRRFQRKMNQREVLFSTSYFLHNELSCALVELVKPL